MFLDVSAIFHGEIRDKYVRRAVSLGLLSLFGACSLATAATLCVNHNGKFGCKTTISAAVMAAGPGDTAADGRG